MEIYNLKRPLKKASIILSNPILRFSSKLWLQIYTIATASENI